MPGPLYPRQSSGNNQSSYSVDAFSTFKLNVQSYADPYINLDGELIWQALDGDIKRMSDLTIIPYSCRTGEVHAFDSKGNIIELTYSRGNSSSAQALTTFVDKDGYIKYSPHNLLAQSETLTDSGWTKARSTLSLSTVIASPYGTPVFKLVEDSSNNTHYTTRASEIAVNAGQQVRISFWAHAAERTWAFIETNENSTTFRSAYFDLANGASGNTSGSTATITDCGNGWYKCSILITVTTTGTFNASLMPASGNGGQSYQGNGTSGIYICRAQVLYQPCPDIYVPTSGASIALPRWTYDPYTADYLGWLVEPNAATNLLAFSNVFTSTWQGSNCSAVKSDSMIGLDGNLAYKIVEDTNTVTHQMVQGNATIAASTTYTVRVAMKFLDRQYVGLQFNSVSSAWNGDSKMVVFDLVNGTIFSTVGTGVSGTITRCRDGWFICTLTATTPSSSTGTSGVNINLCDSSGSYNTYKGNGISGVYVCCAQMEAGDKPSSYIPTYLQPVTRASEGLAIPGSSNLYYSFGSCYLEAAMQRLNGASGATWLSMAGGGGNILYTNADNAIYIWDGTNAASQSTGVDVRIMAKMCSSWGNNLRLTLLGKSINTGAFDGSMGNSSTSNITLGGAGAAVLQSFIRCCCLTTRDVSDRQMVDWSAGTYFSYETPFKAFKANAGAAFIHPEMDAQFQRLTDYLRGNFEGMLPAGAFRGNTVYGMDKTGAVVPFTHSRGTLATQINRLGQVEYCPHNILTHSIWDGAVAGTPGTQPNGWSYSFSSGTLGLVTSLVDTGSQALSFTTATARNVIGQIFTTVANVSYVLSVYVEAFSGSIPLQQLFGESNGLTGTVKTYYDANGNSLGSGSANLAATGRYYLVYSNTVGGSITFRLGSGIGSAVSGNISVILSCPQVYTGNTLTIYCPTTTAAVYGPRVNYNSATKVFEGWLMEGAATNYNANSTMVGAVAGTPGTNPTSWAIADSKGLTKSIVSTGVDSVTGLRYIDIRYNGTANANGAIEVALLSIGSVAASVGTSWTYSVYLQLMNSSPAGIELSILEWNNSNAYLTEGTTATSPTTSQLTLFSTTRTLSSASVASITNTIRLNVLNGVAYDFTLRVAAPQLESGTVVSSHIPTFGSQVTRNADALYASSGIKSVIDLGSLWAQIQTKKVVAATSAHNFTMMGSGAPFFTNNVATRVQSTNTTAGTTALSASSSSFVDGAFNKLMLTWGNGTWQLSGNGSNGSEVAFANPFDNGILGIATLSSGNNLALVKLLFFIWFTVKHSQAQLNTITQ